MAAPEILPELRNLHTISLYVNNKPGVLSRVAITFARRGYNIESLVVSPAAQGAFSRMTITCSGDPETLAQIIRQLDKLVDVVKAVDHTNDEAYETEIVLIKLHCGLEERAEVLQIAEHFNAKVVAYGTASVMLRVFGASEKLDALIELLRSYALKEVVRSGKILMARGVQQK